MNRIERLIELKKNHPDVQFFDRQILQLTEATLPQGGPATSEADTQQRIRVKASELGYPIWRNNSGVLTDKHGRPVRYGLANDSSKVNKVFKSSDLIGIGPGGVFLACECKRPDWKAPENAREKAQWSFLLEVVARGGIGFFATSVEDYIRRVTHE